jgi:hypothetical protein
MEVGSLFCVDVTASDAVSVGITDGWVAHPYSNVVTKIKQREVVCLDISDSS